MEIYENLTYSQGLNMSNENIVTGKYKYWRYNQISIKKQISWYDDLALSVQFKLMAH